MRSITLKPWQLLAIVSVPALSVLITKRIMHAIFLKRQKALEQLEKELTALKALQAGMQDKAEEEVATIVSDEKTIQGTVINNERLLKLDRACFIQTGVLTAVGDQECELNYEIKFATDLLRTQWNTDFMAGCTLKYLAYRGRRDGAVRLIKVLEIENEIWDKLVSEKQLREMVEKHKRGKVVLIKTEILELVCRVVDSLAGQQITLSNEGRRFNVQLSQVKKLEVTPRVGYYVEIVAVFVKDAVAECGELCEMLCIKPSKLVRNKEVDINSDQKWVEIKFNRLLAFKNKTETQILKVFLINNRGSIILQEVEVLSQRTNNQHPYIKLLHPELYENAYTLEKHAEHVLELLVESAAAKSDLLRLGLVFEKFKTVKTFSVVNKNDDEIALEPSSSNKYSLSVLKGGKGRDALPAQSFLEKRRFVANRIDAHELPEDLKEAFFCQANQRELNEYMHSKYPHLGEELNVNNYRKRFQLMLYLEELTIFHCFRQYDCQDAKFLKEGEYLSLLIDNLKERRPSLVVGDTVRILNAFDYGSEQNMSVDGLIHKVLQDRILIKFNDNFHYIYNDEAYNLEFHFSRYTLRKMHHAVKEVATRQPEYLFPENSLPNKSLQLPATLVDGDLLINEEKKPWFKDNLNLHQKRAVCNILRGELTLPYCIFGPPGTGKTVTAVETILQIRTLLPKSRILIAAPSNSAADILATRLLQHMPDMQFLRLISFVQLESQAIPQELLKYCATVDIGIDRVTETKMTKNEDGVMLFCTSTYLSYFSVIISTCTTLGTIMQIKFPVNHFTHALVDEAAQCTEPELMCVAASLGPSSQLIVCGDPQQLPPMVLNSTAKTAGLEVSYMERILQLPPYKKDKTLYADTNGYNPQLVTMLIYNYRSLPSILKVYNDLFYDQELKAALCATDEKELPFLEAGQQVIQDIGEGVDVSKIPPLHGTYFCALKGVNMKKADSPSWYNELEAKHVYLTTMALLKRGVKSEHIGIISPYQKQVRFIRSLFMDNETQIPKIGSIEEFQGQERQIILISTVRSVETFVEEDIRQLLGFLRMPRRMNVAISRARSLVIVFGNPLLLCSDPTWLTYIKYCYMKNTCYGDKPSMSYLHDFINIL